MGFFAGIGRPIKSKTPILKTKSETKTKISTFKSVKVIYDTKTNLTKAGVLIEGYGGYKPIKNTPYIFIDINAPDKIRVLNHEYGHYLWHKKLSAAKKKLWTQEYNKYKKYYTHDFQFAAEEYYATYYAYAKTRRLGAHQNINIYPALLKTVKIISR